MSKRHVSIGNYTDTTIDTCSWRCAGHKDAAGLWANGGNDDSGDR